MGRLILFGNGGAGKDMLQIARGYAERVFGSAKHVAFASDEQSMPILGVDVISPSLVRSDDEVIISLGSSRARAAVVERFPQWHYTSIVASTAIVGPGTSVGEGSVLQDYAMITADTIIGRHFQGNSFSSVAHDCVVGDYVTFAPRAQCNGNVVIGDHVYIGAGALIKNGVPGRPLILGEGSVIGMGAVVIADVLPFTTVVGNPARLLKP